MSFFQDLKARGLLEQHSDPEIEKLLDAGSAAPVSVYAGFDPTADSLHIGSLMPLLMLKRLQRAGHRPLPLVGGATGMIGDPSGKSQERQLLTPEQIAENVAGIRAQLARYLDFSGPTAARLVNNADWFAGVNFIEFLRDIGKHFSVNAMMAKESVRSRLEQRDQGISFTEFSYMLIQSYDFLWLFQNEGCTFQVGGSDQWGNITAGIDLIRRKTGKSAHGFTMPLITTAEGKKFGKTEAGAVWLAPERTSPYQFYQYFLNTDDRDVARLLRYFTFLDTRDVEALVEHGALHPEQREAQRKLAFEVTALIHGEAEAKRAESSASGLFGPLKQQFLAGEVAAADALLSGREAAALKLNMASEIGAPTSVHSSSLFEGEGIALVALLSNHAVKLCASTSDARRQIEQKGIYLNEEQVSDVKRRVMASDLIAGRLLLRKGKKNFHIVQAVD